MRVATLNVQSGGFSTYAVTCFPPNRMPAIQSLAREVGADVMGLVDTFGWAELFSEEALCGIFGYRRAYRINMNCERVDSRVGITVLTNDPHARFETIRLATRDCVKLTTSHRGREIHLYVVYLDDLHEATRLRQVDALWTEIARDLDAQVVILGDLNAMRPEMKASWRLLGRLIRWAPAQVLVSKLKSPRLIHMATVLENITRGEVIPWLRNRGFRDLGAGLPREPTVYPDLGRIKVGFPVDYVLARNLQGGEFKIWPTIASDHRLISAELF